MPQVFQVLCCYNCDMFQVHQVKKSNKWECKVCNEKQSLKKAFKIGSSSDCCSLVQELNMQRGVSKLANDSDSWQEGDNSFNKKECTGALNEVTESENPENYFYESEYTSEMPFPMSKEHFKDTYMEKCTKISELSDNVLHINHQGKNFDKTNRLLPKSLNFMHMTQDEHDSTTDLTVVSNVELCSKQTISLKNSAKHQKHGLELNSAGYSQLGKIPAFKKHCGFQRILDAASKLN